MKMSDEWLQVIAIIALGVSAVAAAVRFSYLEARIDALESRPVCECSPGLPIKPAPRVR